jgi:hypothetical protein
LEKEKKDRTKEGEREGESKRVGERGGGGKRERK